MSTEEAAAVATEPDTVAQYDGAAPKDPSEAADDDSTNENNDIDAVDQPEDTTDMAKGAPQAKLSSAPASPGGLSEGEFEDCKISPLDADNQRRNLKSALLNTEPEPTTEDNNNTEEEEETNNQQQQTSSLLHEDEYSQSLKKPHHPNNHESALASGSGDTKKKKGIFGLTGPPFRSSKSSSSNNNNKPTSRKLGGKQQGHSHPRKSPYRTTNITKLRGSTNTAPDSADFWKQSSKFKHMLLTSVGDFLTGAFADDEETSASYFSRELMEQLSENDPTITGIWLQSKNLYDGDIKVLCDNLMRNTTVTEVWLPGNFITDEGAKYIAHMLKFNKSIKELFLGQNDIGPRGAAALAAALARGNSTLVALGLGENRVGVE
eukprot:CAMPEP_0201708508 /NCGR_PEP_ID=MMETSP0578-20130828/55795_1 /ASSEMBLY_ACC=CAM_ASM_000663 /TAXON_ID=267565 /ORGANISM="Skeletonema grethea, Strain CCMP 1804" /LENGTH=376 /DNA_ID=CAMNT_0048197361 /DNA_START=320 /DNA_END=1447 /DNA_ORIENTATION=+